ncbi:unnamed protein product, partial [marine sediment metagenome]
QRGSRDHFRNAGIIVDEILNTSIILPHQISYDYSSVKELKGSFSKDVLKVAHSCCEEAEREFFFVATLLKEASEKSNKDTAEIFMGIKELRDKKILIPIEISTIEAQPISQQELNLINQNESGLGDKTTAKLIKASMSQLKIGFKSAEDVWEYRKNISRITTSSQELDDLFGGGIETGCVVEFFGEFRTGKTQIAHQLCVNVQLPEEDGGLNGNALYIDTEGTFRPERIIQMSEGLDLDHKKILKNIIFGRAYNSDHQILLVKE